MSSPFTLGDKNRVVPNRGVHNKNLHKYLI